MRKLFLCLGTLVLVACGGNSDDKKVAAQNQILGPVPGQQAGVLCPELNGRFTLHKHTIEIETRVEQGRFSYRFGRGTDFFPADGQPKRTESRRSKGLTRVTCNDGWIEVAGQEDGKPISAIKISYGERRNQIRVIGTGEETDASGVYTQE